MVTKVYAKAGQSGMAALWHGIGKVDSREDEDGAVREVLE
jgi:hypothetical protein